MAEIHKTLSEEKIEEIQAFLIERHASLKEARTTFDTEIIKELKLYNNEDDDIKDKLEHEAKVKEPYIYTMVQTIVARLLQSLFPDKNYLKIYVENPKWIKIEKQLTAWVQEELDKIKFRGRARDFLETGLTTRLSWLHMRPVPFPRWDSTGKKIEGYRIDFDVYDFLDVWFDTRAKTPMDTDFFVKKRVKLWELKDHPKIYFNLDKITADTGGDDDQVRDKESYEAKHVAASIDGTTPKASDPTQGQKTVDEVELLEYYGVIDFSELDMDDENWEPDMKEVICTLANRQTIIRIDEVKEADLPIYRKRLFFPIRPIRQAGTMIGKSIPQLTADTQKDLNEILSLQMDNFTALIKLLFKYNKNADLNLAEFFAGGGNAIGFDEDPKDIDTFDIPNMVNIAAGMAQQKQQSMQGTTGAVDPVSGAPSGRTQPGTATEVKEVKEGALFKFGMMAYNVYDDITDFINYVVILLVHNNAGAVFIRYPLLAEFLQTPLEDLEAYFHIDITLRDLSSRREIERQQWANMAGIIGPMIEAAGGNMKKFLLQVLETFQVPGLEDLFKIESPDQIINYLLRNPQVAQQVMQILTAENSKKVSNNSNGKNVPGPASIEKINEVTTQ